MYLVQVLQDPTSTADLLPEDGCLNLQPLDVRHCRPQTLVRVDGQRLRTSRTFVIRGLEWSRRGLARDTVLQLLDLLIRRFQLLLPPLLRGLHVMSIGLGRPKMLPQLGDRPFMDTQLSKRLLKAFPRLVALLLHRC